MKIRDVVKLIESDRWRHIRTKGSRRRFQYCVKRGKVTIAGELGVEVPTGILDSIVKQAGLRRP